ncbi:tetratricopeptide repeat protein [Hypericibacter sp.]|uniref:tetratricopeptide repeat protein n=1 Tax=Hypericibacter sp. TaxID=2705401 RepID=UPI003D6C7B85
MSNLLRTTTAAGLILGLAIATPSLTAWAAGSSSGTSSTTSTYSSSTATVTSPAQQYAAAKKLVDAQQYNEAIPLLNQLVAENPADADALNLLGFSHRKLGHQNKALGYYEKALATMPNHLGANEYLGELYLEMKDLPHAEERLAVLQKACTSCEEYTELKEKIADYKAKQQS